MIYITTKSPERNWEPFMEWLREHEITIDTCYQIGLPEGEDNLCMAYHFALDADGKRYLAPGTDVVATLPPMPFTAKRPAPRRSQ